MKTRLIVDAQTETILGIEHCYILTIDDLSEEDQQTLLDINEDSGADDEIVVEMAKKQGVKVTDIGDQTGWGDLSYSNAVAYSPLSLRDEANTLLDGGMYDDDDEESIRITEMLKWVDQKATDEQLDELSQYIMQDDSVWNGYKNNFVGNLMEVFETLTKPDGGGNPDTPIS